jgi:hypothetical protein
MYSIYHYDAIFDVDMKKAKKDNVHERNGQEKVIVGNSVEVWQRRVLNPAFPLIAHLCVTLAVGVLIANVQITTRLICASCPIIYVGMAHIAEQKEGRNRKLLWGYVILYNVVGVLLHCNYFPWT